MHEFVRDFGALTPELQPLAGGKGAVLARLFQQGYPVPPGFVVLTTAFDEERLLAEARQQVGEALAALKGIDGEARFAVRSSALGEDAGRTSFAGEFETVLDVRDEEVQEAINLVYRSRLGERVRAYSEAHGLEDKQPMAVVVQRMVDATVAGVLFTMDPVTGSHTHMIGNYVRGAGEQLVSGEADAITFRLERESGAYEGPEAFRQLATELYDSAKRLEKELGGPQDIEFAVADGRLFVLQARPVTTLSPGDLDSYEINESLREDALWINPNVAEAVPDVFSPFTWSIVRSFDEETNFVPGYYVWSGNICGKVYSNISRRVAVVSAVTGMTRKRVLNQLFGDLFGQIPEGLQVPDHGFSRWGTLRELAPNILRVIGKTVWSYMRLKTYIQKTPRWQREMAAPAAAGSPRSSTSQTAFGPPSPAGNSLRSALSPSIRTTRATCGPQPTASSTA